jgi:hypothetical protein
MLMRTISMTAAGAALVVAAVAGCGSNAQPIQVNLAASEVLTQAAQKTAEVTSYTVDAVVNLTHPQQGSGKVQGRMLYQSKPPLAIWTSRTSRRRLARRDIACPIPSSTSFISNRLRNPDCRPSAALLRAGGLQPGLRPLESPGECRRSSIS